MLRVEAFDWNCPQHITPRFSEEELSDLITPLKTRIEELEAELTVFKEKQVSVASRALAR